MKYKVIPAPTMIAVSGNTGSKQAAQTYEDIISLEAAGGWNFVAMDTTVVQNTSCGCNNGSPTTMKIIIFSQNDT